MEFGPINLWNFVIVAIMLIPNIIYAIKNPKQKNSCTNKCMNILEQIGRYACIILMILPLCFDKMKFGFSSFFIFLIYGIGNIVLLVAYLLIWAMYSNENHTWRAISLAIIPTCIFLLTGLSLEHWLLVGAAVIFGISHIYITRTNNR